MSFMGCLHKFARMDTSPRTVIFGAGSIGQHFLQQFAPMAVDAVTLVDGDRVEATNIGRQPICGPGDIGRSKVQVVAAWCRRVWPELMFGTVDAFAGPENIASMLCGHDLAVDCTDDLHARLLIDRACSQAGVPLLSGAVHGAQGQVVLLDRTMAGVGLGDLFPGRASSEQDGCDMHDVPDALLRSVAAAMCDRVRSLLSGTDPRFGWTELIDHPSGQRFLIAPPTVLMPNT